MENITFIKHQVVIKTDAGKVYDALTTQEGLAGWWTRQTIAKPEVGFLNTFTFGTIVNELEITRLIPNKTVEWQCIISNKDWVGTTISFDLEEKEGKTILRFVHDGWREVADMYEICNYNWALALRSLKLLCETGAGTPS